MSYSQRTGDRERRLNAAVARYFELKAAGEVVDIGQWLLQYPDMADELSSLVSNLDFVAQLPPGSLSVASRFAKTDVPHTQDIGKPVPPRHEKEACGEPIVVGPYIDLAAHARGGLGEVFRGTDPALHRTVAVKRLQDRLAGDMDSRRRFLLEAEVTARLEHPGVVPVFGLFLEEDGRPSYAMRFVQGATLWDALQNYHGRTPEPLKFRRLLQAFVNVCQTVAYAHSRGIIHRDLKPQNIMIGKFGEALVLDWGLAKLVGRTEELRVSPVAEETLLPGSGSGSETELGSAVGTPGYMSPEQAAGRWDVIDQSADVYGLGAVLYALLTGKPPLHGGNWPDMQQRIQRGDFPRPRAVQPHIAAPLEAICLKAMSLSPTDRYTSASALAVDIEHWLADEPVVAYPEFLLARSRRWVRRHRGTLLGTILFLLAALGAASTALFVLGRKNQEILAERNVARTAADESDAVNSFLANDLLGQADPDENSRDQQVTVESVLAKAAAAIEGNPKFLDKPSVEATLQLVIGNTYLKLGNFSDAEKHLRRAMQLRRETLGLEHPATLVAQEALADFLNRGPERYEESVPLARLTWQARQRILGPMDRDTLDSLDTYASALARQGDAPEAIKLFRECLDGRMQTLGPEDADTLQSMNNLGVYLTLQGQLSEGVELLRQAVQGREKQPLNTESFAPVGNLSNTLYLLGELEEANTLLSRYVPLASKMLSEEHPITQNLEGFLARVWVDQGKVEQALPVLISVAKSRRLIYPNGSWRTAAVLVDQARALLALGQATEADAILAEARKIYLTSTAPNEYYSAWADYWQGRTFIALQQLDAAEPLLVGAEQRLRTLDTCPHRHYLKSLEGLVALYDARHMTDDANRWRSRLAEASTKK